MLAPFALIAIAAVAVIFFSRANHAQSAAAPVHWMALEGDLVSAGDGPIQADDAFWSGLEAYEQRDTKSAIRNLEDAKTRGGFENLRRLFLASALATSGEHAKALAAVHAMNPDSLEQPWRNEARWIECVALEGLARHDEARNGFEELAKEPGQIGELAREHLKAR